MLSTIALVLIEETLTQNTLPTVKLQLQHADLKILVYLILITFTFLDKCQHQFN